MIKIAVSAKGYPGAALRDVRIKAGMSQKQIAEMTGIPRARISSMEKGNLSISEQDAHTLSRCLNITLDVLWVTAVPEDSIPLSDDYPTAELPDLDDLCFPNSNNVMSLYHDMLKKIYEMYGSSGFVLAEMVKAFIMPSDIYSKDTITLGEGIAHVEVFYGELFFYTFKKHVHTEEQFYADTIIDRVASED